MARRRRRNPWTSTGEIVIWLLFFVLLFPAGFAGWAIGHYTSLGKAPTRVTVTVGSTSTPTTTAAPTTPTTTSSSGGNVAAGRTLFASSGCASCHTFQPANATGKVGPDLDTQPAKDAKTDGNMPLAAFIKQSIVDPNAYIAKGFNKGIMPTTFGTQLKPSQIDDLVAFILSGTSKS